MFNYVGILGMCFNCGVCCFCYMGLAGEESQCLVIESNESCSCENEEISQGHNHLLEEVGQRTDLWSTLIIEMDLYGYIFCHVPF